MTREFESLRAHSQQIKFRDRLVAGRWALDPETQVRILHPDPQKRTDVRLPKRTRTGLPGRGWSRLPCFLGHLFVENLAPTGGDLGRGLPEVPTVIIPA